MSVDHGTKIESFVQDTRAKLLAGRRPYNHLYSIVRQCGWEKRSSKNMAEIQAALERAGVYAEPILSLRSPREEIIRYRLSKPTDYTLENYEPRLGFLSESAFEQFLFHNFDRIPALSEFETPQRQFRLSDTGNAIDILCRRRSTNGYVVIELKQADAKDPVGQLLRYMVQVDRKLAKREKVSVEGLIISTSRNTILEEALAGSLKGYPVQWLTFRVELHLM